MKQAIRRVLTLVLTLCLAAMPALSTADTFLPDGEVTHVDFTLAAAVHPEGFPASKAHPADWAAFLQKLDIKASMDALAFLNPQSRVYMSGALRLNGKEQIPFVYDGYHSYRYFMTPALGNEVFYFQMHNFLEFMLKPYYYMELPTQYLGLLMYPEAACYIGDSFFTPVRDTLASARQDAADSAAAARDALVASLTDAQARYADALDSANARLAELDAALAALAAPEATPAPTDTPAPVVAEVATAAPDVAATEAVPAEATAATEVTAVPEATAAPSDTPAPTEDPALALQAERDSLTSRIAALNDALAVLDEATAAGEGLSDGELLSALTDAQTMVGEDTAADSETAGDDAYASEAELAADGATVYTVPYERLYELCETLDNVTNDDPDLERVYFFFTSLLAETLSSDMVVDTLGRLEDTLDYLDPDQVGMTVVETPAGMTCSFGDTEVFRLSTEGGATDFTLTLPTADEYEIDLSWRYAPGETGAALAAKAAIVMDGEDSVALTLTGEGLPREGDVSGKGQVSLAVSGSSFENVPQPIAFAFDWARTAKEKPYTLGLTLSWLNPYTAKPAVSIGFNGTFTTVDRSVFVEGQYPQNDFFNLNETFLNDYKDRLLKPLLLKLAPILLETPAGVINDLYAFATQNDILVSLVE